MIENTLKEKLPEVLKALDALNAEDPEREDGQPKALLYGRRMTEWLHRLEKDPSPELQIAVRAQHLQRWKIPRGDYPEGRVGYKTWRTDLMAFHAEKTAALLESMGFPEEFKQRVASLIQKQRYKVDPEAQMLEDAACLVFLQFYFEEFTSKHPEEKLVAIVKKTWGKMSEDARQKALALKFPPQIEKILGRALAFSSKKKP